MLDDITVKGMRGKGFERVVGELAGTWLDLGANSVSGNISVLRRSVAEPADASSAASSSSASSSSSPSDEASR